MRFYSNIGASEVNRDIYSIGAPAVFLLFLKTLKNSCVKKAQLYGWLAEPTTYSCCCHKLCLIIQYTC